MDKLKNMEPKKLGLITAAVVAVLGIVAGVVSKNIVVGIIVAVLQAAIVFFIINSGSEQAQEKTGDPRWYAEGGHYNPTAIDAVKNPEAVDLDNAVIYNLNGQRVEKAQKGIYIVNGKKVLFKIK